MTEKGHDENESARASLVYPRVKVRAYEQEDCLNSPQDDAYGSKAGLFSTNLTNQSPAREIEIRSPPSIARIMKVYDMPAGTRISSISSPSKGTVEKNNKNNHGKDTTPTNKPVNARGCSVPPPRAVLSSPDNDGVIGNRNKLIHERSPLSLKGDKKPVHVRPKATTIPIDHKPNTAMPLKNNIVVTNTSPHKAFNCKNGLLQHRKEITKKPEETRPAFRTTFKSNLT
ncbi:hypothetical protein FNV43_RR23182 [Rhamnella rubrinervis]|uniref:Uncharacterized protein n=1 Tax=Rhamnella rubrinervis TaxID=2594499 RepID=A0A8K0GVT0_9ROSA|nr:hypothetical protein FNV43_RR23182 [Rhamnella rubrinervis]